MPATIVNILTAQYDLEASGNPLTITSAGGVEVSGATAIYGSPAQAWTITNAGTVAGVHGISLKAGGTISNGGSIIATVGISVSGGKQSVSNSGTVSGSNDGVVLFSGSLGVVTNASGGTIAGAGNVGVYLKDTAGTVINAGTIIGKNQAIQFVGGGTDLVIADPGAVFVGAVQGGSGTNTLELAKGSGGKGTLSGLSTQFLGFDTIGIDLGASWSLVNAGTLASGTSLNDSGSLTLSGSLGDAGSLIVAGGAAGDSAGVGGSLINTGTLGLTGTLELRAGGASVYDSSALAGLGAAATNSGTLTNAGTVLVDGAAGGAGGGGVTYPGGMGGALTNTGVLINNALISLGGGGGGGGSDGASGTGGMLLDSGTLTNAGTIALAGGGYLIGSRSGGYGAGLVISGTLANSGSIGIAAGDTGGGGPGYAASVTITNTGILLGAGTVNGAGALLNHGSILASGSVAVGYLFNDGTIGASATLTDAGTLVNNSSIAAGVTLTAGATLENSGTIATTNGSAAVYGVASPPTVSNSGTITGSNAGILLLHGGQVTNLTGGSIVGLGVTDDGVAIYGQAGFVTNSDGSIAGADYAINLDAGGTITNLAGGVLHGTSGYGLRIGRSAGTVINAGTIIGGDGFAAVFLGNYTDRVVVYPGAVFVGNVEGGGGSNTLELAQGTGGNAGTLSALSTQFSAFDTIGVDLGAAWSLVNAGMLVSVTSLNVSGSLTLTGILDEGGSLIADGGASESTSSGVGGSLVNTGTLGLTGMLELQAGEAAVLFVHAGLGAAATNSGTLTNAGTVLVDGAAGGGNTYPGGSGGALTNTGVLINNALISLGGGGGGYNDGSNGTGGMLLDSGTLTNAGTIELAGGGTQNPNNGLGGGYGAGLVVSGTLANSGSIGIAAGDTGGSGPGDAAAVTITDTGTLSGAGTVNGAGALFNHGSILASGSLAVGYLFNDGTIGASTTLTDAGTLVNQGSIATGVTLASGATLDNVGTIASTNTSGGAVYSAAVSSTVTNFGTITGAKSGILLLNGGQLTNLTGGSITGLGSGYGGVAIDGQPGFVSNTGSIVGAIYAIDLAKGGTISNLAGGVLHGTGGISGYGVYVSGGDGTVINAGTIIGDGNTAVKFHNIDDTDRVIVDPGAVFVGNVAGGEASNTLELAPGSSGNTGTISGIGTQFLGFATLVVDAGADWAFDGTDRLGTTIAIGDAGSMLFNEQAGRTVTVAASLSGSGGVVQSGPGSVVLNGNDSFTGGITLAGGILELSSGNPAAEHGVTFAGAGTVQFGALPTGTIFGFASTDTIDLASYGYVSGANATLAAGNTLVVQTGDATFDLLLDPTQDFDGVMFSVQQDSETGVLVEASAPCYARGTHLLTARGEVAIETLQIGDQVMTASGALRPIRWIGLRSYGGRTIAGNCDILPIRIRAGALADGVPRRDLQVSPKHAMFLDGVLIPAELLVNGVSITQPEHVGALTYYHVELDSHDILIAEGALSESFIDHDSRVMFQNAATFFPLHPVATQDYAPRVEDGKVLARVRRRIAARAGLRADHADDADREGPLDGRIDLLDETEVGGWAFDALRPHTAVRLDILDGERIIGTVVANRFRPDLKPAGKGAGRCAYVFRFDIPPADLRLISIRRASDGAMLSLPEAILRAA